MSRSLDLHQETKICFVHGGGVNQCHMRMACPLLKHFSYILDAALSRHSCLNVPLTKSHQKVKVQVRTLFIICECDIIRFFVGCARWQHHPIVDENTGANARRFVTADFDRHCTVYRHDRCVNLLVLLLLLRQSHLLTGPCRFCVEGGDS